MFQVEAELRSDRRRSNDDRDKDKSRNVSRDGLTL